MSPDFEYYRIYLQAGVEHAESYLLLDELYAPLNLTAPPGMPSYPAFTLGGWLLYQALAQPLADTASRRTTLDTIQRQMDVVRVKWRVAWEKKATWEFQSRLRQWSNTVTEIRREPADNADYYPYEVRRRVQLALLRDEVPEIDPAYLENLANMDRLLNVLLKPGDFIWDAVLAPGFPKDEYWYLWGLPYEI